MISTVSDLLEALKDQEANLLDQQNIIHAPTIGSMYEGLTKDILEKALPEGLDLKVVSGFITNESGEISKQVDCMLVEGNGEKIPYTDDYKYDINNVIAVIEVKKNLYTNEMESAYKNLVTVRNLQESRKPENQLFIDAHRQILQSDPRDIEDANQLPFWKRQVGLSLYRESILPLRIALGYHGFASELNFREAFMEYLGGNLNTAGFSPTDFPNLIISEKHSLIKLDGMPYGTSILKERQHAFLAFDLREDPNHVPVANTDLWAFYASYPTSPILLLLQLLWTRLTYMEKVSDEIFGLDLDIEIFRPLILAKAIEQDGKEGWHYEYFALSEERLESIPLSRKWEPIEISVEQATLITQLGTFERDGMFNVAITELLSGRESQDFIKEKLELLRKANLISVEDGFVRLLTKQCAVVAMPDGRLFAADADDPRFTDWIKLNS